MKHATHLAFCTAAIVFVIMYALPAFVPVPLLWYQPADRSWVFDFEAPGIAIDFYGRCAMASVVATVLGATTYAALRRFVRREPSEQIVSLFGVWAISLTLLAMAFFGWRLAHRTLTPPPIPSWYQAR